MFLVPQPVLAQVWVNDGDTITIQRQRIRLACIDAPEKSQTRGEESKATLVRLIGRATPQVVKLDKDRYGRTVASLKLQGKNLNIEMVRQGQAFVYDKFLSTCPPAMRTELKAAEELARQRRLGVWADERPEYPWQWRRENGRNGR